MPEAVQLCRTAGLSQRNLPSNFQMCCFSVQAGTLNRAMQHLGNCLDVVRLEICAQCLLCDEVLWYMKPMVPWSHWFWHMSSKTGCCMGYYLAFIRLSKLRVHMTTDARVKSITSVLPICVEQLIVLGELNPFRGSAEKKGCCFCVCRYEICTACLV